MAWERAEPIGPRSFFEVFKSRRSFPACEAVFFEVGIGGPPAFISKSFSCGYVLRGEAREAQSRSRAIVVPTMKGLAAFAFSLVSLISAAGQQRALSCEELKSRVALLENKLGTNGQRPTLNDVLEELGPVYRVEAAVGGSPSGLKARRVAGKC